MKMNWLGGVLVSYLANFSAGLFKALNTVFSVFRFLFVELKLKPNKKSKKFWLEVLEV